MACHKGVVQHRWSEEEKARLAEIAPGRTHAEIREIMTEAFGDHFGGRRISSALKRFGIKTGISGQLQKGCAGGFKSEEHKRSFIERGKATRFRKGNMPHNAHQPIGTEREDSKDGYLYVKIAERKTDPKSAHDNWKPKHHLVYEKHHGQIPEGCNIVFADHETRSFDPDNLVAVPRSLWSTIAHGKLRYWDRESLEVCMNAARLDQARYAAECSPRKCRVCGAEFRPRFAHHRTCDACSGRR